VIIGLPFIKGDSIADVIHAAGILYERAISSYCFIIVALQVVLLHVHCTDYGANGNKRKIKNDERLQISISGI
jgi:hypothetical protein